MSQDDVQATRRDFLYYATGGTGAVVVGAAVWPLVNQMNPSADVQALSSIEVDISGIEPGTQITVKWLGKPVFIRRRTSDEINLARDAVIADLPDGMGRNANAVDANADDKNRTLDEDGEWLVMMGVCTHLGCVPLGDGAGEFGGWFCPCHGSMFDMVGRVYKGVPAPTNLPVPPHFFDGSILTIGEDGGTA